MKPEGLKHFNYPGKTDCHPKRGYRNWWEGVAGCLSRKTRKQIDARNQAQEEETFNVDSPRLVG